MYMGMFGNVKYKTEKNESNFVTILCFCSRAYLFFFFAFFFAFFFTFFFLAGQ